MISDNPIFQTDVYATYLESFLDKDNLRDVPESNIAHRIDYVSNVARKLWDINHVFENRGDLKAASIDLYKIVFDLIEKELTHTPMYKLAYELYAGDSS